MKKNILCISLLFLINMNIFSLAPDIEADRHLLAARSSMDSGDYEKAKKHFDKILELNVPIPPKFYYHYGRVLVKVGNFEVALEYINNYLEMTGRNGEFYRDALELYTVAETGASFKFEFCLVEAGTFYVKTGENNLHEVIIKNDYYISKYEINQKMYRKIMGNNPSNVKGDHLPVNMVTWYDAVEFCNKLSILYGLEPYYKIDKNTPLSNDSSYHDGYYQVLFNENTNGYRLPTEAQWEFAARGGIKSKKYIYSGSNDLNAVAWHYYNSNNNFNEGGLKLSNELGIYDMTGNLAEWCWNWDWTTKDIKKIYQPATTELTDSHFRVTRGGAFTYKGGLEMHFRGAGVMLVPNPSIGIRLVRPVF